MRKEKEIVLQLAIARGTIAGLKQKEIAKKLGVDPAKVSRLLQDNPFVIPATLDLEFPEDEDKEEILERSEFLLEGAEIKSALRQLSPFGKKLEIEILHGSRVPTGSRGFDRRATQVISDLVSRSSLVGVAWDMGIKPYATEIPGFVRRDHKKGEKPIRFIPLCGITSSSEEALINSSTVIAMRYHRLINRHFDVDVPQLLNLNCIPLVHPVSQANGEYTRNGRPDSTQVIRYLKKAFPDYEKIYGDMSGKSNDEKPLIDKVDMIFTGCGNHRKDGSKLLDLLYPGKEAIIPGVTLNRKPLSKKTLLDQVIVGDIAGILLPDDDAAEAAQHRRIVNQLNKRLATLRQDHLHACCVRACRSRAKVRPPGVVLIAHGELSARPVMKAVQHGLVSTLIIDHRLAKEIVRRA